MGFKAFPAKKPFYIRSIMAVLLYVLLALSFFVYIVKSIVDIFNSLDIYFKIKQILKRFDK